MHLVAPTHAMSLKKEGRFALSSVAGLHYNGVRRPGGVQVPWTEEGRITWRLETST